MTQQPHRAASATPPCGTALKTPAPTQRHDPQGYLRALLVFMAAARDHLDDPHYETALPHLEALRAIPEPRDPDRENR